MKKSLFEQTQRIKAMMEGIDLNELNVKYMDQLLDKISSSGMDSLTDYEKEALQKLSNDQDVSEPEVHSLKNDDTLRFTTIDLNTGDPLVRPQDASETFGKARLENAYIHGEAADLAGYELPYFIDGDLSQLDKPQEEQDIRLLTNDGEWECVAHENEEDGREVYYITLKELSDEDLEDAFGDDEPLDLGEMEDYDVSEIAETDIDRIAKLNQAKLDALDDEELTERDGFASDTDALEDDLGDIETQ